MHLPVATATAATSFGLLRGWGRGVEGEGQGHGHVQRAISETYSHVVRSEQPRYRYLRGLGDRQENIDIDGDTDVRTSVYLC